MANCQECGKVLYPRQNRCSCGWKNPSANNAAPSSSGFCDFPGCSNPGTLSRTLGDGGWHCTFHFFGNDHKPAQHRNLTAIASRHKQHEVNSYIRHNQSATKREACLNYLKAKGLYSLIPKSVIAEDEEARMEREAIQLESNQDFGG